MTANLFDVLKKINEETVGSVVMYPMSNVENINAGKKGWGNVKIAITTEDATTLMQSFMKGTVQKTIMLFVVDVKVMKDAEAAINQEDKWEP